MMVRTSWTLLLLMPLLQLGLADVPPRFTNVKNSYEFPEDSPLGTIVIPMVAEDPDTQVLDFSISGDVANDILEVVRTGDKSANAILKSPLDREVIDKYQFYLVVTDRVNPDIPWFTTLYVKDVNDNAPTFVNLPYRANVKEDTLPGTSIYKVSAVDPDSGFWGVVSYSITPNQTTPWNLYSINRGSGVVNLTAKLDYETEKFYQLEIMGTDGGGLNSTTDLIINVIDVQDTPPYFLNQPYLASIKENVSVGTPVLQVSALDGDRGVPNKVNYTFTSGAHSYFNIDPDSGWITVATPIDREHPDILSAYGVLEMTVLTTEVTDNPQGDTTATARVTIRILDVNDQVPTFEFTTYEATIQENTQTRVPVSLTPAGMEMLVKDMDEGDNGRFELSLEKDGLPFNVFYAAPVSALNEASVLIRVQNTSALDYEAVHSYTFQVVARENLTLEKHEGRATVTVQLEDVNDNRPEFTQENYNASILENSPIGTYVTTITATDRDSGLWGLVSYNLQGGSSKLFSVDSQGVITVAVNGDQDQSLLDREKLDTLFLQFEAIDGGGLRESVELQITLLDVNDNAPIIARSQYEGYVKENALSLDNPLFIEASDIDLPPNNVISFYITDGDPMNNFTMNMTSGQITLTGPLDYEAMNLANNGRYQMTVMAQDGGTPPLNNNVPVIINVQDVNDERPVFNLQLYEASIPENITEGTRVTVVTASDADGTAPNNEIIYRIESGARDKFRINADTGVIDIETGANLDRDLYGTEYTLTVLAIDRGTPPLSGSAQVHVNITDINNKHPEFIPPVDSITLLEDTMVGVNFHTYTAVDKDTNALLKYALLPQVEGYDETSKPYLDQVYLQSLFDIHADNGTLFVKSSLDRETVELIIVSVFVEDLNAEQPPVQNATATLRVTLGDVNDNPPRFEPSDQYQASVSEAASVGTQVVRVSAVDPDKNQGDISYFVVHDSEESQAFEITDANRFEGQITLATTVDHEENQWINITVRAVDSGNPPLNSTARVYIQIEDVNDNRPEWKIFNNPVSVWENATLNTFVTQVEATDPDSGEFGRVMYYISGNLQAAEKFIINNTTGEVFVNGPLDRETVPSYSLDIEAHDNNLRPINERRVNKQTMTINLLDVNDFTPQFTQPYYMVSDVQENAKVGSTVIVVLAIDRDQGNNAKIDYTLHEAATNASGLFDIRTESDGGHVIVAEPLTGRVGWFYITVIATDRGQPPLSNQTTVYLFVEDLNYHGPVIVEPPHNHTSHIWENCAIGTWVTRVQATDDDTGRNGEVRYAFVMSEANRQKDWLKFNIDEIEGNITTKAEIDREEQETYLLEVRAYDLGGVSFEDRRTIRVIAMDEDDNPPSFSRTKYPPPHPVSILEEHSDIYVGNLSLAEDPDIGNNSIICYYIVGGDKPYKDQFHINKTTGELWLGPKLDREEVSYVNLILLASPECHNSKWEKAENQDEPWDYYNNAMLLVEVKVIDINDNPPRFSKSWFTAGVTKDTQFSEPVINLHDYAHDPDEGNNSVISFYISSPFWVSEPLATTLRQRGEHEPFTLGTLDGIIRTNIYFLQNMQGYFGFSVYINDSSPHHHDTANVSIYLLNQDQRVKVKIRAKPAQVNTFKDHFAEYLSNITGAIINVDSIRTHQDSNGQPDEEFTDMFIHAIDRGSGEVLPAKVLIDLIDRNYLELQVLFKTFNVVEVVLAVEPERVSTMEEDLKLALILVAVILGVILLILALTFITCRRKYKRKLKAATAMAFDTHNGHTITNGRVGSKDQTLNTVQVPGTNLHSYEGSNPIWLEKYEPSPNWQPPDDNDSQNSLDNNMIDLSTLEQNAGYDEQELSMQVYGDDPDSKIPISKLKDDDQLLVAAIQDHDQKHNNLNNGMKKHQNGILSNHFYENAGFTAEHPSYLHAFEATEI